LVVDDDPTVAEVVVDYLRHEGMEPRHAADGHAALRLADAWRPDLVVLDVMLPGIDGLEVCRRLRDARGDQTLLPVIMLTARGEEDDRVLGLETGADDYVTKPFSPRELALRVQAVLRRGGASGTGPAVTSPPLRSGRIEVDVAARQARKDGRELTLTVREFELLAFFMANPGQAFTRAELMKRVWGWSFGDQSTVTVHVRRVRNKVEEDPASPLLLRTVRGIGYCWDAAPPTAVPRQLSPTRKESRPGAAVRTGNVPTMAPPAAANNLIGASWPDPGGLGCSARTHLLHTPPIRTK
jgi:two-component system, OmpR family, response regulator ResD